MKRFRSATLCLLLFCWALSASPSARGQLLDNLYFIGKVGYTHSALFGMTPQLTQSRFLPSYHIAAGALINPIESLEVEATLRFADQGYRLMEGSAWHPLHIYTLSVPLHLNYMIGMTHIGFYLGAGIAPILHLTQNIPLHNTTVTLHNRFSCAAIAAVGTRFQSIILEFAFIYQLQRNLSLAGMPYTDKPWGLDISIGYLF